MTTAVRPPVSAAPPHRGVVRHPWFRARTVAWLRVLSMVAFVTAAGGAIVGFLADDPMTLAIAGFAAAVGFLASDFVRAWREHLSPATLMALAGLLMGMAHIVAFALRDGPQASTYFIYAVDEYIPLALKIALAGTILPILGFRWVMHSPIVRPIVAQLPVVEGRISLPWLIPVMIAAAALGITLNITRAVPALGTLTALFYGLPHLAAFVLARVGATRNWRAAIIAGLLVAIAEAIRALWFAYLRSDVIAPIFAYAAGLLLGARSLKPLKRPAFIPVYVAAVLFTVYFAAFAEARGISGMGLERLTSVQNYQQQLAEHQRGRQNLLSRLTTHNQLSQIGRIVEEDGFLDGETLEYLGFVFIPRFLWPEKPEIAKGSWFALRIGQARLENGRITNAVNMTVAGEFYLNFGWPGVLLGTFLFGAMLGAFWARTDFWRDPYNVLGAGFGYYLLWTGFFGAADLQIVVTLLATYGLFVIAGFFMHGGGPGVAVPRSTPPPA